MNNITINSNSNDIKEMEKLFPRAPLKIIAMEGCKELGQKVNDYIVNFRQSSYREELKSPMYATYLQDNYLVDAHCPRFGSGEAKGVLNESVRGKDLFIMTDVCNYSLTYSVNGYVNHMSPDDHYQDLKRLISAANGKEHRLNIIMPFLYESRQHKRTKRESLDCALALQELIDMGVDNIFTFDAHDPRVQNAIPLYGFDSFNPPYQFMKALLRAEPNLSVDPDHLMIISPDEGAMSRAVYFSNVIDDMISSGESMLDVAKQMKDRGAKQVFVCTTFGLFTDGFEKFDEFHEKGYIDRVITTNLTYLPPAFYEREYFTVADMSKFIALIIDSMNHDVSISSVLSPTDRLHALLERHRKDLAEKNL